MKTMFSNHLSHIVMMAVFAATLTGCGGSKESTASAPVTAPPPVTAGKLAASNIVLREDGTVWAWGNMLWMQGKNFGSVPSQIPNLSNIVDMTGTTALRDDGTVWEWDTSRNEWLKLENVPPARALAGDIRQGSIIAKDGTVWFWGRLDGKGGGGVPRPGESTNGIYWYNDGKPHPISGIPNLSELAAIAIGTGNELALFKDGTVIGWGNNEYNKLGTLFDDALSPQPADGVSDAIAIATAGPQSLALTKDGGVLAWGGNRLQSWGAKAVRLPLSNMVAISASDNHAAALGRDGTVWVWGPNDYGQLGDGSTIANATPTKVPGLSNVIAIAAGDLETTALKNDGSVWTWGMVDPASVTETIGLCPISSWGYHGQFRYAEVPCSKRPVQVKLPKI